MVLDNLFVNGGLGLWERIDPRGDPSCGEEVICSRWRQTFLADRWKVRYDRPEGVEICQQRSREVPEDGNGEFSLELQGQEGLSSPVYVGQRIEAGESLRYRRRLRFSAQVYIEGGETSALSLLIETPIERDRFGGALNPATSKVALLPLQPVETGEWSQVEVEFDGRSVGHHGLSVELVLPAELLSHSSQRVRLTALKLADANFGVPPHERPFHEEAQLAARYFQRHTIENHNSLGRAIAVDRDALYFQLNFPAMRTSPSVHLPLDDISLKVHNFPHREMNGFRYEMLFRNRGTVTIKANKAGHGLSDGYLSFVGPQGAILLNAEL